MVLGHLKITTDTIFKNEEFFCLIEYRFPWNTIQFEIQSKLVEKTIICCIITS
jgi:hypothetical protein